MKMTDQSLRLVPAPLYRQVEEHLARRVHDGTYAAGTLLPSDAKLCEMFGVSRITVRHAIDKLVISNLVRRHQGVGTIVNGPDEAVKTASLVGYIDDVHPHIDFKLLKSELREPPTGLAKVMGLAAGKACRCYVNLNHVGREPLSYVESFFPDDIAPLLSEEDFSHKVPPSRLVEMRSGRTFSHALQTMGAVGAPNEVAEQLGVQSDRPIMRMERTYFAVDGSVLEATIAHYHPKRYQFSVRLVPHNGITPREVPAPDLRRGTLESTPDTAPLNQKEPGDE